MGVRDDSRSAKSTEPNTASDDSSARDVVGAASVSTDAPDEQPNKPAALSTKPDSDDDELSHVLMNWDMLFIALAMMVVAIAVAFPASNSELWLHLASGREVLQGEYPFGGNPFIYTGGDHFWVNHSWLFDVSTYLIYNRLGDTVLVIAKILVVGLLMTILLQSSQNKNQIWAAFFPAVAALVALWVFYDLRDSNWLVILKSVVLVILWAVATSPDNWQQAPERWISLGAAVLAVAGAVWLYYDLGMAGPVIALKLLVFVALMRIWMSRAPQENTMWWPTTLMLVALIALMPTLILSPMLFSLLFMASTYWFLERGTRQIQEQTPTDKGLLQTTSKAYWPLLVVFVLWANMDSWFLLGPLLVLSYTAGKWLAERHNETGKRLVQSLGLLLGMGVLVCVLNPHHVQVFSLPPELTLALMGDGGVHDPLFVRLTAAPWQSDYFWSNDGPRLVALAYWGLVALGGISFVLNLRKDTWPRGLVWSVFLLLSLFKILLVPFFIIVAAPITALNLIEYSQRRLGNADQLRGGARAWVMVLRLLGVLAALVLLGVAWPGLIQRRPLGPPFLTIESDPYLMRTAAKIQHWREVGKIPKDSRGVNVSFQTANYFAWKTPDQKSFMDSRLQADAETMRDFLLMRQALFGVMPAGENPLADSIVPLRSVLRKWNANHLIVHAVRSENLSDAYLRLSSRADEWVLLYLDGRTAVYGWRDPERIAGVDPLANWRMDPGQVEVAITHEADRAQPLWPRPRWWDMFVQPGKPPSAKREQAYLHLLQFSLATQTYLAKHSRLWVGGQAAAQVTDWAPTPNWIGATFTTNFRNWAPGPDGKGAPGIFPIRSQRIDGGQAAFLQARDDGPVLLLYDAIRAARQAVRDNPRDGRSYFLLGQAYHALAQRTRERIWVRQFPNLGQLRTIQTIAALKQAVRLQPDLVEAHAILSDYYWQMRYWDFSLEHQKLLLQQQIRSGPLPGESRALYEQRKELLEEDTRKKEAKVNALIKAFETDATNLQVFPKVNLALEMGLGQKSLEILLDSDLSVFGKEGMNLELQLLLTAGRVNDINEWMAEGHLRELGPQRYYWLRAQTAAALGTHKSAMEFFREMTGPQAATITLARKREDLSKRSAIFVGDVLLDKSHRNDMGKLFRMGSMLLDENLSVPMKTVIRQALLAKLEPPTGYQKRLNFLIVKLQQDADAAVLRGLMALESGRSKQAANHFREALSLWRGPNGKSTAPLDFRGRPVAEAYVEMLVNQRAKNAG